MSKYLVVVESPTKAKTISKFLGRNYKVVSSMGHVRDLPKSSLGIDVEADFEPKYINIRGKGDIIKDLKKSAKDAERIYYAADPDREGEAIAWHLNQVLSDVKPSAKLAKATKNKSVQMIAKEKELCRIEFNEITKDAIKESINNPRPINVDRVMAQQSRRILDRLVGYKLSPLLWKKIKKGLSAGRVQSVAVKLICDRQQEIDKFVPEEYWSLDVDLLHEADKFNANLIKVNSKKPILSNAIDMDVILKSLDNAKYSVLDVKKKERSRKPLAPFTTSLMQQEAYGKLGFTAKKTMQIAQQLYEGINLGSGNIGLITYMRSDSVRISESAQEETLQYIAEKFGKEYCPEKPNEYSAKGRIQNAHEAIRPTSIFRDPSSMKDHLSLPQFRLYKLIWDRLVASQMASAKIAVTVCDITANDCLFRANGNIIIFPGFLKIYKDASNEKVLPELHEGDILTVDKLNPTQHFTQPPPLFTEATLIKTLEKLGVGRPSTYVPIIETIIQRGYVVRKEKALKSTELGKVVLEMLTEYFSGIINAEFTANMESQLDKVEDGLISWKEVLHDFYDPFSVDLAKAEDIIGKIVIEDEVSDVVCENCGCNMVYKMGKYGKFLACPGFPDCRNIKSLDKDGNVDEKILSESDIVCENCGKKMVYKMGRYGKFLACPGFPECKNIKPIVEPIGIKCPKCGADLIKRRSKRGKLFYGCENYPECDTTYWNMPTTEACKDCGHLLVEKTTKKNGTEIICENKDCPSINKEESNTKKSRKKSE